MILTLKIIPKHSFLLACVLISFFAISFSYSHAQDTRSLSVSPTLYEMSANPGQVWTSSIKIINPNPYPLTVYTDTVNFVPSGETGQPRFLPVEDEVTASSTLAGWIQAAEPEVTLPPEQTVELPFKISVPDGAPPGGHFAAVLIGTKPPEDREQSNLLETSQIVTSLVFLRVAGEVIEAGNIRSFRTSERILNQPAATFELRFENTGNTHVIPQGDITILNMWGQERGVIPINQTSLFGNVLPESVRKYTFNWTGEWSIADVGRYRAIATVGYGDESRSFANAETTFWVIPWKPLLVIFVVLFGFIFLLTTVIRWYIRRVLSLSGVPNAAPLNPKTIYDRPGVQRGAMTAPIGQGMLDLRHQFRENTTESGLLYGVITTIRHNYRLVVLVLLFVFCSGAIYWFISGALADNRGYKVEIVGPNETVSVSSEDIAYNEAQQTASTEPVDTEAVLIASTTPIQIINRSGVDGLAATMRVALETAGVTVADLDTDLGAQELNTVIVYDTAYADEALILSQEIGTALLSAYVPGEEGEYPIVIYVGSEYEDAVE